MQLKLGITAERLQEAGVVDKIIPEPLGGAHRDYETIAASVKSELKNSLNELRKLSIEDLLAQRYAKLRSFGNYQ